LPACLPQTGVPASAEAPPSGVVASVQMIAAVVQTYHLGGKLLEKTRQVWLEISYENS
jgi:hypothetical protein